LAGACVVNHCGLLCCLCLTPAARTQAVWAASTTSAQGVKAKTGVMRASAMLAAALVALCCSTLLGHAEASWSGGHPFPPECTKWSPCPACRESRQASARSEQCSLAQRRQNYYACSLAACSAALPAAHPRQCSAMYFFGHAQCRRQCAASAAVASPCLFYRSFAELRTRSPVARLQACES